MKLFSSLAEKATADSRLLVSSSSNIVLAANSEVVCASV